MPETVTGGLHPYLLFVARENRSDKRKNIQTQVYGVQSLHPALATKCLNRKKIKKTCSLCLYLHKVVALVLAIKPGAWSPQSNLFVNAV